MTTITFDTHQFVKTLQTKGFNSDQAEGIVEIMQEAQNSADLATKKDLFQLELKMAAIDMKISDTKTELVKWVVSVGILQMALITALMIKLTG